MYIREIKILALSIDRIRISTFNFNFVMLKLGRRVGGNINHDVNIRRRLLEM